MASEISWRHASTGKTVYATIRSAARLMWNGAALNELLETPDVWTDYDIPLTETPASSYFYVGTWPAGLTTVGWYWVDVYEQAGGAPAISDPLVGTLVGYWNGTAFLPWAGDTVQVGGTAQTGRDLGAGVDAINLFLQEVATLKVTGGTAADGTYQWYSTRLGFPVWSNGVGKFIWYDLDGSKWILNATIGLTTNYWYCEPAVYSPVGTYSVGDGVTGTPVVTWAGVDATRLAGSTLAASALAGAYHGCESDRVVVVAGSTTDTGRAANLRTAYTAAKALTPGGAALSATNRAKLLIPPGRYDLVTTPLVVDGSYVDLEGLGTKPSDVELTSQVAEHSHGTVEQSVSDVRARNLRLHIASTHGPIVVPGATDPAAYFPATGLPLTEWTDVEFASADETKAWSMAVAIEYAGKFTRCTAGKYGFGGYGTASGTFTDCEGGIDSFAGGGGLASGTFVDCEGTTYSFGGNAGFANGTFTGCVGGDYSFGSVGGEANGTFTDCHGGDYAFGGDQCDASGVYVDCSAGDYSFGSFFNTNADGLFVRCRAGDHSFGGYERAAGIFIDCIGGHGCYGGGGLDPVYGVVSGSAYGTFINCYGGADSFGGNDGFVDGATIRGCTIGGDAGKRNCTGALFEDCVFHSDNAGGCLILKDSATRVVNCSLSVSNAAISPIVTDGTARSVYSAGNRLSGGATTTGLGADVTNLAKGDPNAIDIATAATQTLAAGASGFAAIAANSTTMLARLGAWTGTGVNTILGALKALFGKSASLPSDIGGTFQPSTDSLEALGDKTALYPANVNTAYNVVAGVEQVDLQAQCFKNGTLPLMARVYGDDGNLLTQATVASIKYSIYLLDDNDSESRTAVTGHSAATVVVASSIFDTLQTDVFWTADTTGYNFKHTPPNVTNQPFAKAGRRYLVEYTITPAGVSSGTQTIVVRFRVNVI